MGSGREKVNRKVQQFYGGNWGHPRPDVKRRTEIPDPLVDEVPKHKGNKKYKKKKEKPKPFWRCPFCDFNIEKSKEERKQSDYLGKTYYFWDPHHTICSNCKAFEIANACPACKRDTWFKPDDKTLTTGEYRHMSLHGCGFSGRKKL